MAIICLWHAAMVVNVQAHESQSLTMETLVMVVSVRTSPKITFSVPLVTKQGSF